MKGLLLAGFTFLSACLIAQPAGWGFNQPIGVTNPNSVNAVDYQLKMIINTQSLITAGMMLSNGNDIRFGGTCTGSSFFNYWIEAGINTPTTVIWVKIPFIAANSSTVIFMFFGNSGASAASTIPGTFRGPNSSTDSVSGGTTGGSASTQRGFRFQPTQDLLVTHFGKYEPTGSLRYVTIFNYTSTAIITQTQVGGPAYTYSYGPITNPIWLANGSQYVVQLYQGNGDGYVYMTSSQIGQHLTYLDMRYCNSCTQNTFPTSVLANYHYGFPDFLYYITNTLTIPPTYTLTSLGTIAASPSSIICSGQTVTLTANIPGATTYTWNNNQTTSVIIVSPTSNTSYTVSTTNGSGCSIKSLLNLTVSPGIPTLAVSGTTAVCLGAAATVSASGALTYSWTNNISSGVQFTPAVTGTYVVTGTNGCGTSTAAIVVSVAPLAVGVSSSPTLICAGKPSTLTAVATATAFNWSPGALTTPSIIVSPTANTVYTVSVSDGTCSGTNTLALNVDPNPTLMITTVTPPTGICAGATVNLAVSGALTYTWSGGTLASNATNVSVSPSVSTLYNVSGTNTYNCISTISYPIIVLLTPTVQAIANPTYICANDPVDLISSGAHTYTWSTGAQTNTTIVNPVSSGVYTVTGTYTTSGCMNTRTVAVTVFIPTITITGNTAVCLGETAVLNATGADTYSWNTGLPFPTMSVSPLSTTIYTLTTWTQTDVLNCPSGGTFQVVVNPNPTVTLAANRTTICKNEKLILTAGGADTYSWSATGTGTVVTLTPSVTGNPVYNVTGTNSFSCSSTASIQLKVNACTGVSLWEVQPFKVFPNPNRGEFEITAKGEVDVELVNELGQLITTIRLNSDNHFSARLHDVASGIYFLRTTLNGRVYDEKLLITK
jgi:hypothetical protein